MSAECAVGMRKRKKTSLLELIGREIVNKKNSLYATA